ncbi:hypothetical protein ACFL08_03125 [Patescibacteria group bacterium]
MKKTIGLLVLIIGVVFLSGCSKKVSQLELTATPEIESSESKLDQLGAVVTVEDCSGEWVVYRNEDFGLEISYPCDWEIKAENGKEITGAPFNLFIRNKSADSSYSTRDAGRYYYPNITIHVESTDQKTSREYVEDCQEMNGKAMCPEVTEYLNANGLAVLRARDCFDYANREGIMFVSDGYMYSISMPYLCEISVSDDKDREDFDSVDAQYHETFEKIMKTFKVRK